MHERTTNSSRKRETKEIYSPTEAPSSQGMGRTGNGIEVAQKYQIHPQTLYRWKKALEQGAQIFLGGKKSRVDPYPPTDNTA